MRPRSTRLIKRIHAPLRSSPTEELGAALAVLVERLATSRVEDADGVAHVAITAGSLVEAGAPSRPLGESLVACLPPPDSPLHVASRASLGALPFLRSWNLEPLPGALGGGDGDKRDRGIGRRSDAPGDACFR